MKRGFNPSPSHMGAPSGLKKVDGEPEFLEKCIKLGEGSQ
jgi:hypothetical protein